MSKYTINGNITITKHTQYLSKSDWFLCENPSFLPKALKIGPAGVILTNEAYAVYSDILNCPYIITNNPGLTWAEFAVMANPRMPKFIAGVTGTNGKTSTAFLAYKILKQLGAKAGYIGTLGIYPDVDIPIDLTTPDAAELHQILSRFDEMGVSHAIMEVSSSGLQRHRVAKIPLDIAVFTSFGQDHLDVHQTIEDYWKTKLSIATLLKNPHRFYVNPSMTNQMILEQIEHNIVEQKYSHPKLVGFMLENLQAACCICEAAGYVGIQEALESMDVQIPGRLQVVAKNVVVDFAHTPEALERLLQVFAGQKIVLVFGCGGDRDSSKREMMGKIAAKYAQTIIITDDNPRSEDPDTIRSQIIAGCPNAIDEPSRYKAIHLGITIANRDNGVCIIAGKGHETHQIYANNVQEFSDVVIAREIASIVCDD